MLGFDRGFPDVEADRLLEGVSHGPADQDIVAFLEKGIDDLDLIGNLEATEDRDIGAIFIRDFDAAGEVLDLNLHEVAFRDLLALGLEDGRNADGGSVGAVGRAEGIHDERIGEGRPFLGEFRAILLFAFLITGVLDEKDFAVLEGIDFGFETFAPGFRGEDDLGRGDEFGEAGGDASHVVGFLHGLDLGGIGFFPFDLAKVGHEDDPRAVRGEILDGGKGFLDAVVIADDTGGLRDVEVHADEDLFALEVLHFFDS